MKSGGQQPGVLELYRQPSLDAGKRRTDIFDGGYGVRESVGNACRIEEKGVRMRDHG